jgi:hypothetical protein
MGLSFHYSGSIAKQEDLSELIAEVKEIANVFNWKYNVYESQFPENAFGKMEYNQSIYGISFTPPECETISISFLSNGRMSSNLHLKFYGKTNVQAEKEYLYMLSVKTQFAGVELHQFIIELFRYLHKKYFANFELKDDGGYWLSNDIEVLKSNFKKNSDLLDNFSSAIESIPVSPNETMKAYFERIIEIIRKKK